MTQSGWSRAWPRKGTPWMLTIILTWDFIIITANSPWLHLQPHLSLSPPSFAPTFQLYWLFLRVFNKKNDFPPLHLCRCTVSARETLPLPPSQVLESGSACSHLSKSFLSNSHFLLPFKYSRIILFIWMFTYLFSEKKLHVGREQGLEHSWCLVNSFWMNEWLST